MSEKNISWFHCGLCGSLFQSTPKALYYRCSACGHNPSPVVKPKVTRPENTNSAKRRKSTTEWKSDPSKKKLSYRQVGILVIFCLAVMLITVIKIMTVFSDEAIQSQNTQSSETKTRDATEELDQTLLNEAVPRCNLTISGFLASGTPEGCNQYVSAPVTTAGRMADFYKLNPLLSIDPKALNLTRSAVLHMPAGNAIELNFGLNDDLQLDAVFINENGEWRLDWDHFVRYSKHPWPLFLAGGGSTQGEFRLLARQRLADDRKNADTLSLVFYTPQLGRPSDLGSKSPEFLVKRDSKNGRLLEAAFNLEKSGKRAFGVNLPSNDPEGIIRVRVKVRRVDENDERHFVLEDVVACHWYSIDEPGMEVSDQPLDQPLDK